MLHRYGSSEIKTFNGACSEKWGGVLGSCLFFDERSWRDGRQRRSYHPPIAENVSLGFFGWGVGNRAAVECMDSFVRSNDPRSEDRPLFMPRLPSQSDAIPSVHSFLSQNSV